MASFPPSIPPGGGELEGGIPARQMTLLITGLIF